MSLVRRADATDIPWLLEQLCEFADFAEFAYPGDAFARGYIGSLLDSGQPILIAQNDVRTGFLVGSIQPYPFTGAPSAFVHFWWAVPKYRHTYAIGRLLVEFREIAQRRGVRDVFTSVQERAIAEGLMDPRSLEALGFRLQERGYRLQLSGVIS